MTDTYLQQPVGMFCLLFPMHWKLGIDTVLARNKEMVRSDRHNAEKGRQHIAHQSAFCTCIITSNVFHNESRFCSPSLHHNNRVDSAEQIQRYTKILTSLLLSVEMILCSFSSFPKLKYIRRWHLHILKVRDNQSQPREKM